MIEEEVTRAIIKWLIAKGWEIVAYDLPQTGTGQLIPLLGSHTTCTGEVITSFIPDIITRKDGHYRFFENKAYFALSDFHKVATIRAAKIDLAGILNAAPDSTDVRFGVGVPDEAAIVRKCLEHREKVDFLVFVGQDGSCRLVLPC